MRLADDERYRQQELYESAREVRATAPKEADVLIREALSLWRGRPYADVEAHGYLDWEITRLSELRLAAQGSPGSDELVSSPGEVGTQADSESASRRWNMFNEPSVDVICEDGDVVVELQGATLNDPTTGDSTFVSSREIECWFIDTEFEDEFVIREAFFPRGELPSPARCRWLRSQIPSSLLNPTRSSLRARFPTPRTGRIAVWVSTRHGDEAAEVLGVDETNNISTGRGLTRLPS